MGTCKDLYHDCNGKTHRYCGDQLCCWGPAGKRVPCPAHRPAIKKKAAR